MKNFRSARILKQKLRKQGNQKQQLSCAHWCSQACQEGDWKLHQQDPLKHQNNRASEDCPSWDCSDTQEVTIHQVIHETYDRPMFME